MNKKKLIVLISIAILLLASIVIGTSYAMWSFSHVQELSNVMETDCFKFTYIDQDEIDLNNTFPITEEEANELIPYQFTIKNVCNHNANYNINIETLNNSNLGNEYIRVKLSDRNSKLLSEYQETETTINKAKESRVLESDVLYAGEEKQYTLRIWLDEEATNEEVGNKIFTSKITLKTTLNKNNNLIRLDSNGGEFSDGSSLKTVALNAEPVYDIEKYAHTDNINDEGIATGNYANNLNETKEVTIEGATKLHVVVTYQIEGTNFDYLCIYDKNTEVNTSCTGSVNGTKLGGNSSSKLTKEYDINGDTAKFNFKSDGSQAYYGYYAIITGYDENNNKIVSNTPLKYIKTFDFNSITNPEYPGYIFEGWYSDSALTNKITATTTIGDSVLALYAKYIEDAAIFNTGMTVSSKWKTLAKGSTVSYSTYDTLIISIQKSETLDNTENIISSSTSNFPIYTWYDNGTIYWYSEASKIYLNSNSSYIFRGLTKVTELDLSLFDTSKVTNMSYMLSDLSSLTSIDLSPLNTSNVTNMSAMFQGMSGLTSLDLSKFNTSKVTNMSQMFAGMSSLTDLELSSLDTSSVTDMHGIFALMTNLTKLDLSPLDTSNVTNMGGMFSGMSSLTSLDLSPLDMSSLNTVSDIVYIGGTSAQGRGMFYGMSSLTSLDLSPLDTSNVTSMTYMFYGMSSLTSIDLSPLNTSNVKSMYGMFEGMSGLTSLDLSSFDTSKVTNMSGMFKNMRSLTSLNLGDKFGTSSVTDMSGMFQGMSGLTSLDISSFNTTNVTDMSYMFYGMSSLISLDLSPLDTSKVENMNAMFNGMSSLTSLDLSTFNTSNVTNMGGMFQGMSGLTSLDISSFNTTNVTGMSYMFKGMSGLTSIDLSGFDTTNVIDMSGMFQGMSGLTSLDLSSFNTSKVTKMNSMFNFFGYSPKLTNIIFGENFDTTNVTNMSYMFEGLYSLTNLDLSTFDTTKVTNMSGMFSRMSNLQTIYVNPTTWNIDAVTTSNNMFLNDADLVGGQGTTFDSNHIDIEYARIDGGTSSPGYLTDIANMPSQP